MADAKMAGKEALLRRLASIPEAVRQAAEPELEDAVEEMRQALQRAAPVAPDYEKHPGELRESIQKYPNPGRPLSWRIIAGARDAAGRLYGRFVEFGHGLAGPRPFWFPTYRAQKKRLRSRMYAAVRKRLKVLFPQA